MWRNARLALLGFGLVIVSACSNASGEADAGRAKADSAPEQQALPAPAVRAFEPASLKTQLTSNFTSAVMKTGKHAADAPIKGSDTNFGMTCSPATVSAQQPGFEIVLPEKKEDRTHVFAVITPGGKLYEIYTAYGYDVEAADLQIPSQEVSWEVAAKQAKFALTANGFSGVEVGKSDPVGIFIEKGAYQFALVSSIQKDLIEANRTQPPVTVYAGCVINYAG